MTDSIVLTVILNVLIAILLSFYRLIKGPTVFDRITALDSIGIMFLVILVLLSRYYNKDIFLDVALVYGVLLFVDILIMSKYFGKRREVKED